MLAWWQCQCQAQRGPVTRWDPASTRPHAQPRLPPHSPRPCLSFPIHGLSSSPAHRGEDEEGQSTHPVPSAGSSPELVPRRGDRTPRTPPPAQPGLAVRAGLAKEGAQGWGSSAVTPQRAFCWLGTLPGSDPAQGRRHREPAMLNPPHPTSPGHPSGPGGGPGGPHAGARVGRKGLLSGGSQRHRGAGEICFLMLMRC